MGPKYEFTGETMNYEGHFYKNHLLLHRIRRLSDNKLGGWIEKEENLSQEGNCWVDGNAKVFEDAKVYGNAKVSGEAEVCHNAKVYGNAKVYDNTIICGGAKVFDNAKIYDEAQVYNSAWVYGNARVYDKAQVYISAQVYDNAQVYGKAKVFDTEMYGNTKVYGNAKVCGDAVVWGAEIYGDAILDCGSIKGGEYKDNTEDSSKEVIQDFIYKVNDSNKIATQIEYDSIDEFFNAPITNDIKLDTLVICAVDTKESLIKLQKIETNNKTEFKFIVDIINEDGDNFMFKSIIKSQEQLNQLIQQTIEALKLYPKFNKYVDDLENCL